VGRLVTGGFRAGRVGRRRGPREAGGLCTTSRPARVVCVSPAARS